jgi:hypothetical protein
MVTTIAGDDTIRNSRSADSTADTATGVCEAVCYSKTGDYGICIFVVMKIKTSMLLFYSTIAVNNRGSHNVWVIRVDTSDGDGLAVEINITVTIAGICAGIDCDDITIISGVYSSLNVIEIRRAIVIDVDYAGQGAILRTIAAKIARRACYSVGFTFAIIGPRTAFAAVGEDTNAVLIALLIGPDFIFISLQYTIHSRGVGNGLSYTRNDQKRN